jgi:hypothetical protein
VKLERNIRCYLNVTAGRTKLKDNLATKGGNSKDLLFEETIRIGTEFITLFVGFIAIFTTALTELIPVCCGYNWNTKGQSTQTNFIGTTLHVSDHSIHRQVHKDMKFADTLLVLITFLSQYVWDCILHNKGYSKTVYKYMSHITTVLSQLLCNVGTQKYWYWNDIMWFVFASKFQICLHLMMARLTLNM